jgi:hypothetical protein
MRYSACANPLAAYVAIACLLFASAISPFQRSATATPFSKS